MVKNKDYVFMAVPAEFEDCEPCYDDGLMQTNGMGWQDKGGVM
jgi:hypothetical protein